MNSLLLEVRPQQQQSLYQFIQLLMEQEMQMYETMLPHQRRLWVHWGGRLTFPDLAMLPKDYRNELVVLSKNERTENNRKFSHWLDKLTKAELRDFSMNSRNNISSENLCVHIGVGVGLGINWLNEAVALGFSPLVFDWQVIALKFAAEKLRKTLKRYGGQFAEVFFVKEAVEACKGLDHKNVSLLQISRVLEHLTLEDAREALFHLGKILAYPLNRIVVVDALKSDENDKIVRETSIHLSLEFILEHCSEGAGKKVVPVRESQHTDRSNTVLTALTLMAEQS